MKKSNFLISKLTGQIFRFGVVGGIAFVIDYAVLVILTELLGVWYFLSALIAYILSFLFNFYASMRYVFSGKEGQTRRAQFSIFAIISVIALVMNQGLLWVFVENGGMDYLLGQIITTCIVMAWNYLSRKKMLDD